MKKAKTITALLTALTMTMSAVGITAYADTDTSVLGDANSDGKTNVRDCAVIANASAKGTAEDLPDTADYNKDKKKNVRDAAALSKDLSSRDAEYINSLLEKDTEKAVTALCSSIQAAEEFEKTFDGTFDKYDENDVYAEYELTGLYHIEDIMNGKVTRFEDLIYDMDRDGYGLRNIIYTVRYKGWMLSIVEENDGSFKVCSPVLPNGWKSAVSLREEEQKLRLQIDEEIADVKYGGFYNIPLNRDMSFDLSVVWFKTVSGKEYVAPYIKARNFKLGDFNYALEGIESGRLYTGEGFLEAFKELIINSEIDESYLAPEIEVRGTTYSLASFALDEPLNIGKEIWRESSSVTVETKKDGIQTYPVDICGLEVGPDDCLHYDYYNFLSVYYPEQKVYTLYRVAVKPTDEIEHHSEITYGGMND